MSTTQTQLRRGSTAAHAGFTGAEGELTIDTDLDRPVIHDGALPGGFPAAMLHVANVFSQPQTISLPAGTPTAAALTLVTDAIARVTFRQDGFGVFHRQEPDTGLGGFDFTKRGTTGDSLAALSSGSGIAGLNFRGWDGAALSGTAASIRVFATEAWTPAAHGTSILFLTTPIGSTVVGTRATLTSASLALTVPLNMGTNLINNVVDPVAAQDAATKSYVDGLIAAGAPPFTDSTALVKGSGDPTKLMRFEVDGFTAATTRVLTPPDADITLAGINIAQTFALSQAFTNGISLGASSLLVWTTRSIISSPADGILRLTNNAQTNFTRLQFGGTTAAFPAIGRNGTQLEILGADGAGPSGLYIYNTKTSAANFERLDIQWAGNVAQIWTEKGSGAGTARNLSLGTDAIERLLIFSNGRIVWGGGTGSLETDGSLFIDGDLFTVNIATDTVNLANVFFAERAIPRIGFFGVGPNGQQDVVLLDNQVVPGGPADTLEDIPLNAGIASLGVDLMDQSTVPDKATVEGVFEIIRNDTYQLGQKVNQIIALLEAYGLSTP